MDSGQFETLYNRAAKVILDLNEELTTLSDKFGKESSLVSRKADQLAALIALHDNSKDYIAHLRHCLKLAEIVNHYKDLIVMQKESGLPWEKVARLYGWDELEARKLQSFDDKVSAMYVKLADIVGPELTDKIKQADA